jgi:hypothetical protein
MTGKRKNKKLNIPKGKLPHHVLGKLKPGEPPDLNIPQDIKVEHIVLAVPVEPDKEDVEHIVLALPVESDPEHPEGKSVWQRIWDVIGGK